MLITCELTMDSEVFEATLNCALKAVHDTRQHALVSKIQSVIVFERLSVCTSNIYITIGIFLFHSMIMNTCSSLYVLPTSTFLLYESYMHLSPDQSSLREGSEIPDYNYLVILFLRV